MKFAPLNADTDLAQAIEDFAGHALEIREMSTEAARHPRGTSARANHDRMIHEQMSMIDLRARRLGLTGAVLFEVINAAIDSRARRGRPTPARDTSRTLITNVTNAHARIATALNALREAQEELEAAEGHLEACEAACAAWGIKGALR